MNQNLFDNIKDLINKQRYEEVIQLLVPTLSSSKSAEDDKIAACYYLSSAYNQLGCKQESLVTLFQSFVYDLPRAELTCKIGQLYLESEDYSKAIFWFEQTLALNTKISNAFAIKEYWGYIPALELSRCHLLLGAKEKANLYSKLSDFHRARLIEDYLE